MNKFLVYLLASLEMINIVYKLPRFSILLKLLLNVRKKLLGYVGSFLIQEMRFFSLILNKTEVRSISSRNLLAKTNQSSLIHLINKNKVIK
jgi:hypothetical protein